MRMKISSYMTNKHASWLRCQLPLLHDMLPTGSSLVTTVRSWININLLELFYLLRLAKCGRLLEKIIALQHTCGYSGVHPDLAEPAVPVELNTARIEGL